MNRKTKLIVAGGAFAVAALAGATAAAQAAVATDDETDAPITGQDLERATEAALSYVGEGEGEVTDTEVGDEESYYEVEVTLPDGGQVDVQLDEEFNVVGSEGDGPGEDD